MLDAQLALDAEGRILALSVDGDGDGDGDGPVGAQIGPMSMHPLTANLPGLAGAYATPLIAVEIRGHFVNTMHMNPYRGAGRPEANYVIERMIDIPAARLEIDRIELRRRNLVRPEAMPHATPLGFIYDSGDFPAVLETALTAAGLDGFPERRAEAAARGKLLGFGVACAIESAGGGPPGSQLPEYGAIRMDPDRGMVLAVGSGDSGQGHDTAYRLMAEHLLGWRAAGRIAVVTGDTAAVPRGTGTFGSRTMGAAGAALAACATQIIRTATEDAAEALEAAAQDVVFENGTFRIAGTDREVTFEALVETHGHRYAAEAHVATDAGTFPNGAHVAEIEVDPETGETRLLRYVVADDVGTVINPLTLAGQVHGGVAQGLGQALMERIVYDPDSGALLTGSLMDYAVPRAADMPLDLVLRHVPTPTAANPLGAKGAGESGTVGALAAAINAVCDALAPFGVTHLDMPASPSRVWQAIHANSPDNGGRAP